MDTFIRLIIEKDWLQAMKIGKDFLNSSCDAVLNSTDFVEELKRFDLLVHDGPLSMCGPLFSERLGIARVEILMAAPIHSLNPTIPRPISYIAQSVVGFTDKMTFMERVIYLMAYLGSKLVMELAIRGMMNGLKEKYNITPERSYQEAVFDAEMVIIAADFALEYPQPLLPGITKCGFCRRWRFMFSLNIDYGDVVVSCPTATRPRSGLRKTEQETKRETVATKKYFTKKT